MASKLKPIPSNMKEWFNKNYPGRKWENLTTGQKFFIKKAFGNRNNPYVVAKKIGIPKFTEFLKEKKKLGQTYFEGGIEDIMKQAGVSNISLATARKIIRKQFPNTFSYRNIKFEDLPNIEKEIINLAKKNIPPSEAFKILMDKKIIRKPNNERGKGDYTSIKKFYKKLSLLVE